MTLSVRSDVTGGALLSEGPFVAMQVTAGGIVTFPQGLVKQSQAKRCMFHAFLNATVSAGSGTFTKVPFNAKMFDPAGVFDAVTNRRFQPNVAGLYQINATVMIGGGASMTAAIAALYKNNALYKRIGSLAPVSGPNLATQSFSGSVLVPMNGSTDYLELFGYNDGASNGFTGEAAGINTHMSGYLVEAD